VQNVVRSLEPSVAQPSTSPAVGARH